MSPWPDLIASEGRGLFAAPPVSLGRIRNGRRGLLGRLPRRDGARRLPQSVRLPSWGGTVIKLPLGITQTNPEIVPLRCPACRREGSFAGLPGIPDAGFLLQVPGSLENWRAGVRVCPNPACRALVFVVTANNKLSVSFPAERLDFEPVGIPPKIVGTFEEAITDHANGCYRSAAIMVRRTLEEICADRNATASDLKGRLQKLRSVIVVPQELLDAADELRILGNDAAHLEARVYDDIGKDEVEVAIALCKELLKAVYQYASLVQKLRDLKGSKP